MTDARRIIAQHADTLRLLGVDFMPVRAQHAASAHQPGNNQPGNNRPGGHDQPDEDRPPTRPHSHDRTPAPVSRPTTGTARSSVPAGSVRDCHEHLTDPAEKLEALRARYIADAPHARFVTAHTSIVFGEGDPRADLLFVGEAPGETEDREGRPFVGRAGQLLDKMIVAMGLARERVYICNVLKTRPPDNATPTAEEAAACAPYLVEQIRIVAPRAIVTLGLPATHLLLGTNEPMRALRGRWWSFPQPGATGPGARPDLPEIPVMPTYHPAYLLRSYTEENRRKVWSDLRMVMDRLASQG